MSTELGYLDDPYQLEFDAAIIGKTTLPDEAKQQIDKVYARGDYVGSLVVIPVIVAMMMILMSGGIVAAFGLSEKTFDTIVGKSVCSAPSRPGTSKPAAKLRWSACSKRKPKP